MKKLFSIGLLISFTVASIGYSNPTGFAVGVIISEMRKGAEEDRKKYVKKRRSEMRRERDRERSETGSGRTVRDGGNRGTRVVVDPTY